MKSALKPRKTKPNGFTLVELLVAITIFSLVVGMAMFSLRFSFGIFRHLNAPFAEETRLNSTLRDCIASTNVYLAERHDMFNRDKKFYIYYYGEPEQLTFVSSKPISGSDYALCRIALRNGAVVIDEIPLYADDSDYLSPSMATGKKSTTVIFPEAKGMRLEYVAESKPQATMKETLPSLVKMSVTRERGTQEFYYRIPADFSDKHQIVRGLNEPL
ncbi:hypothetical protein OR1_00498 [Geobacter sp. OR-1]|uniref:PulJ/GspJ family protein n=1 Tax=Geobacter sp. OR-1 TaxID=1266765 RepID=UPI0005430239|nr:type II secretion system protein [Geobacter sp. OR-1]GAM08227.1 hypothetical protein OR1_00498 [Geobacter sp. OR-1]